MLDVLPSPAQPLTTTIAWNRIRLHRRDNSSDEQGLKIEHFNTDSGQWMEFAVAPPRFTADERWERYE